MAENERVTYPLSNCQQQVYYQIVYSPNKRLLQIPLYITVNQVLDFDLLRKAIEIEYERNDSLRLRFFRDTDEKQTVRQYFLPEVEPNIKVMDFSGKTKKQQDDGIGADANEVQDWLGGDLARFILFKSFDGGTGIYVHISHLIMDASAIILMYTDILAIYNALRDGTDMPKPLDRFEVTLAKDIEYFAKPEQMQKDSAYFAELYSKHGEPTYAGACGMGPLKRQRLLFRNKNQKYIVATYALSERIGTETMHVTNAELKKIFDACEANKLNINALIQLAARSYTSKVNNNNENILFTTVCSRRSTRIDKNSGGCRMNSALIYSHVEETMTAREAVNYLTEMDLSMMRHINYSILYMLGMLYKMYNTKSKATYTSFALTYLPFRLNLPEGWKIDYKWYDPGNAMPLYIFVIPDLNGDGLMFNYEYRKAHIKKRHMVKMHEYIMKFMNTVAENPDMKMSDLLKM